MSDGALVIGQDGVVVRELPRTVLATVTATGHTLDQLRLAWLIEVGAESMDTRDAYGRDVLQYLDWCAARGVDPLAVTLPDASMFAGWLNMPVRGRNRDKPYSPRTRRRKLGAVASYYIYLHRAGAIGGHPWRDVKRPARPKGSPTRSPALDLVVLVLDTAAGNRFRGFDVACGELIIAILVYLGVRASAVCNLRIEDFNFRAGTVTVLEKGGGRRVRPVPAELMRLIGLWLGLRPTPASEEDAPYLLLARNGRRINRLQVYRLVKWAARLAGVPDPDSITPHSLRHAFNDVAKTLGFDIEARRDALGHQSTDTTEIYTHVGTAPEDDPVHEVARVVHAARRVVPAA